MSSDSYYKILEINKDATEKEISKAFKQMSKKYHPDKAPADKKEEYTEKFKEINEAHDVLKDPSKRKLYDMGGKDAVENGGGPDLSGMFGGMFGNMFGGLPPGVRVQMGGFPGGFQNQKKKMPDIIINLKLTLEEIYKGQKRKVKFTKDVNGTKTQDEIEVEIPAGCGDNVVMVKRGGGHDKDDHIPGDVKIAISHIPHEYFKVNDNDLIIEKEIEFGTSILGVKFTIKHLDGQLITIETPGPIQNEGIYIIPNKGLPHTRNKSVIGNLIVKYQVNMNIKLNEEQKKVIRNTFKCDNFSYNPKVRKLTTMSADDYSSQHHDNGGVGVNIHDLLSGLFG